MSLHDILVPLKNKHYSTKALLKTDHDDNGEGDPTCGQNLEQYILWPIIFGVGYDQRQRSTLING